MTVTARITASRTVDSETTQIVDEIAVLDMTTPNTDSKIRFHLGMKVPEVFGRYSSLDISVSVEGHGDPEKFEDWSNQYVERMLAYEQDIVNRILAHSGLESKFNPGANDG